MGDMQDNTNPEIINHPPAITPEELNGIGPAIAITIWEAFGDKIYFSALSTETGVDLTAIDEVNDRIKTLSAIGSFDANIFEYHLDIMSRDVASNECGVALQRHTTALQRGTALIFDEETQQSAWISIPKPLRQQFVDNIKDVVLPPMSFQEEFMESSETTHSNIPRILDAVVDGMDAKLSPLIVEIPDLADLLAGKIDGLRGVPVSTEDGLTVIIHALPDNRTLKSIKRKALQACEFLDEFIDNPEKVTAEWCLKLTKQTVLEWGREFIESSVMERNTVLYNSLSPEQRKAAKEHHSEEAPKLTKRQKRRLKQAAQLALQNSTEQPDRLNDIEITSNIDNVEVSLPWVSGGRGRLLDVSELRAGERVTYILNGIEEKLQPIADATLGKEELAEKITNSIWHQARIINGGRMPWETAGPVKPVNKNGKSPDVYKNESIWYVRDVRPNAPRVYFVVKDAQEVETTEQKKLQPDAKCVVVVGITDKSRQIDVLKRFTGKSHAELVANGAGSI